MTNANNNSTSTFPTSRVINVCAIRRDGTPYSFTTSMFVDAAERLIAESDFCATQFKNGHGSSERLFAKTFLTVDSEGGEVEEHKFHEIREALENGLLEGNDEEYREEFRAQYGKAVEAMRAEKN